MRNTQLEHLMDLSRDCDEVKTMIRVVCDHEGATSAGHLYDVNREAFDELCEAADSLVEQLGVD